MTRRVLLVDSDTSSQEQCARVLRDCACEPWAEDSPAAALTLLGKRNFDAILLDLRLAGRGGCDLPAAARHAQPGINIILMVDGIGNSSAKEPLRLHGYLLLTKPLKIEELAGALDAPPEAIPQPPTPSVSGTAPTGPAMFPGLVGSSERMKRIYRLVSKVAVQRHPVLITGDSGTGKELVARAIHTSGPWRDLPFVPVDCGALPPTLIESELFGHVKGAFTGANQARQGLLASAGAGTVFLDEIGELPIELQSRLLRALQEHEIRPLGDNERVRFEARIIAATNQNLDEGMKRGTFRKDLFFRLNVVSIKMPSLRERKEDIPELVRYFLDRFKGEKQVKQISDEVVGRLMSYDWPGNVRDLENCIQHAITLGSGAFVQLKDLPSSMLYRLAQKSSSQQKMGTLNALEEQAIRHALVASGGDRVRAARLLGIGKTTIYRKLKEYGIDIESAAA
ncbi:MAG: sigma-54-dependent transcriptional regulator [Terriglobia bacterium]